MRSQTVLILTLALAFGGVAAIGVLVMMNRDQSESVDMTTIAVVATDVPRGDTISSESVVARKYPKDLVPVGVLTQVEDAIGRTALVPLIKDEPLIDGKLAPKGAGRGLASLIKKGMRAITVQTPNIATGVAGFIVPGNHVDVLMTFNETGRDDKNTSGAITLLENVEILAVDQKVDAPAENRVDAAQMRSVTLSVTPEQATKVTLGQNRGTIHLSLRNSTDDVHAPSRGASISDLRGATSWGDRLRSALGQVQRSDSSTQRRLSVPTVGTSGPPRVSPSRTIRTFRGTREGTIKLDTTQVTTSAR